MRWNERAGLAPCGSRPRGVPRRFDARMREGHAPSKALQYFRVGKPIGGSLGGERPELAAVIGAPLKIQMASAGIARAAE